LRFVSLAECGTHILFGTRMADFRTGEITLAHQAIASLQVGMLCLADRRFFGFALWEQARATGAALLWRVKKSMLLPCEEMLADGSYLSRIYPSSRERRHNTNGVTVRVIEYTLEGVPGAEDVYRLVTTVLNPEQAPVAELAALYQQRWEIEGALDELKTHLRGSKIALRSKTPELVRQEFYGLMLAHFAIRGLMHEAALEADIDPDQVSFVHAVRVIRRKLPHFVAIPPSGEENLS
jgi:IS4 transposase